MTQNTKDICREAYEETQRLLQRPEMRSEVRHGLTIMYGPPLEVTDLALLSFQGGGGDVTVQESWPDTLLYVKDATGSPGRSGPRFRFGQNLGNLCRLTGLWETLQSRTIALPAVFPQGPQNEANAWMAKSGSRAEWRGFSVQWGTKILLAHRPKAILIFGEKASEAYRIQWIEQERKHSQGHLTFARADWNGIPTFFCHHLSQGFVKEEALKCFRIVKETITK